MAHDPTLSRGKSWSSGGPVTFTVASRVKNERDFGLKKLEQDARKSSQEIKTLEAEIRDLAVAFETLKKQDEERVQMLEDLAGLLPTDEDKPDGGGGGGENGQLTEAERSGARRASGSLEDQLARLKQEHEAAQAGILQSQATLEQKRAELEMLSTEHGSLTAQIGKEEQALQAAEMDESLQQSAAVQFEMRSLSEDLGRLSRHIEVLKDSNGDQVKQKQKPRVFHNVNSLRSRSISRSFENGVSADLSRSPSLPLSTRSKEPAEFVEKAGSRNRKRQKSSEFEILRAERLLNEQRAKLEIEAKEKKSLLESVAGLASQSPGSDVSIGESPLRSSSSRHMLSSSSFFEGLEETPSSGPMRSGSLASTSASSEMSLEFSPGPDAGFFSSTVKRLDFESAKKASPEAIVASPVRSASSSMSEEVLAGISLEYEQEQVLEISPEFQAEELESEGSLSGKGEAEGPAAENGAQDTGKPILEDDESCEQGETLPAAEEESLIAEAGADDIDSTVGESGSFSLVKAVEEAVEELEGKSPDKAEDGFTAGNPGVDIEKPVELSGSFRGARESGKEEAFTAGNPVEQIERPAEVFGSFRGAREPRKKELFTAGNPVPLELSGSFRGAREFGKEEALTAGNPVEEIRKPVELFGSFRREREPRKEEALTAGKSVEEIDRLAEVSGSFRGAKEPRKEEPFHAGNPVQEIGKPLELFSSFMGAREFGKEEALTAGNPVEEIGKPVELFGSLRREREPRKEEALTAGNSVEEIDRLAEVSGSCRGAKEPRKEEPFHAGNPVQEIGKPLELFSSFRGAREFGKEEALTAGNPIEEIGKPVELFASLRGEREPRKEEALTAGNSVEKIDRPAEVSGSFRDAKELRKEEPFTACNPVEEIGKPVELFGSFRGEREPRKEALTAGNSVEKIDRPAEVSGSFRGAKEPRKEEPFTAGNPVEEIEKPVKHFSSFRGAREPGKKEAFTVGNPVEEIARPAEVFGSFKGAREPRKKEAFSAGNPVAEIEKPVEVFGSSFRGAREPGKEGTITAGNPVEEIARPADVFGSFTGAKEPTKEESFTAGNPVEDIEKHTAVSGSFRDAKGPRKEAAITTDNAGKEIGGSSDNLGGAQERREDHGLGTGSALENSESSIQMFDSFGYAGMVDIDRISEETGSVSLEKAAEEAVDEIGGSVEEIDSVGDAEGGGEDGARRSGAAVTEIGGPYYNLDDAQVRREELDLSTGSPSAESKRSVAGLEIFRDGEGKKEACNLPTDHAMDVIEEPEEEIENFGDMDNLEDGSESEITTTEGQTDEVENPLQQTYRNGWNAPGSGFSAVHSDSEEEQWPEESTLASARSDKDKSRNWRLEAENQMVQLTSRLSRLQKQVEEEVELHEKTNTEMQLDYTPADTEELSKQVTMFAGEVRGLRQNIDEIQSILSKEVGDRSVVEHWAKDLHSKCADQSAQLEHLGKQVSILDRDLKHHQNSRGDMDGRPDKQPEDMLNCEDQPTDSSNALTLTVSTVEKEEESIGELVEQQKQLLANQLKEAQKLRDIAEVRVETLNRQIEHLEMVCDVSKNIQVVSKYQDKALKHGVQALIQLFMLAVGVITLYSRVIEPLRGSLVPT